MSKLETNTIDTVSGTTNLTIGSTNSSTISVGSPISNGLTLSDNILFDTASKGIYLGVTSATASNLLDDYEEGTWNPDVYNVSSNNSTWSLKVGRYLKIGDQVTCWFLCDSGNSGTSGSGLTVGGLPFTIGSSSVNINFGTCGIWGSNGMTERDGSLFLQPGTTTLKIHAGGSGLTSQPTYCSGTFTYRV